MLVQNLYKQRLIRGSHTGRQKKRFNIVYQSFYQEQKEEIWPSQMTKTRDQKEPHIVHLSVMCHFFGARTVILGFLFRSAWKTQTW